MLSEAMQAARNNPEALDEMMKIAEPTGSVFAKMRKGRLLDEFDGMLREILDRYGIELPDPDMVLHENRFSELISKRTLHHVSSYPEMMFRKQVAEWLDHYGHGATASRALDKISQLEDGAKKTKKLASLARHIADPARLAEMQADEFADEDLYDLYKRSFDEFTDAGETSEQAAMRAQDVVEEAIKADPTMDAVRRERALELIRGWDVAAPEHLGPPGTSGLRVGGPSGAAYFQPDNLEQ